MSLQEELQHLKTFASAYDWRECSQTTTRLFQEISIEQALLLTLEWTRFYLPIFEEHNPTVTGVRQLLDKLAGFPVREAAQMDSDLYKRKYDDSLHGSGVNTFIEGVYLLAEGFACYPEIEFPSIIEFVTDTVYLVARALALAEWAKFYPREYEAYERWERSKVEYPEDEQGRILTTVFRHPLYRDTARDVWLTFAKWFSEKQKL